MDIDTVTFSPSLIDSHFIVDVRTPLEYQEDSIPGAVNVPFLTNEERVEIGTLYKQTGPREARVRGLELTAHRFPEIVETITRAAGPKPILVYCWRGGLRSKTVTAILDLTGATAVQLKGGYKAFRQHVSDYFDRFCPPGPLIVIHGMTGIGKTTFLLGLKDSGLTVIDLEGLACHRGSAFGGLGLTQDLTQKRFETLVWEVFRAIPRGTPVLLEGESKRIGRLSLPGNLYEVMQGSCKVWCEASLETRVARLTEEYGRAEYREGMAEALLRIKKKLGGERYSEIAGHLDRWEMEPFMAKLVVHYYDRVYYRTREWQQDLTLSLEDYEEAGNLLQTFLRRQFP